MKVILDLGRRPEARFLGVGGGEYLRDAEVSASADPKTQANAVQVACVLVVMDSSHAPAHASLCHQWRTPGVQITWDDLKAAESAVGDFGSDNRAGVQGTLHRISAMRSRKGTVVGLTCRVGRAVTGHVDMIRDILDGDPYWHHA